MITIEDARYTLGTLAVRMTNEQIGSVVCNLRFICNRTIDTVITQNLGTCGTVSL